MSLLILHFVFAGSKFVRGMTDHPNTQNNSQLPHFYSYNKRPALTSSNSSFNLNYGHSGFTPTTSPSTISSISAAAAVAAHQDSCNQFSFSGVPNELTESNLRENVEIVLNNLNRNAVRSYLNEKINNNHNLNFVTNFKKIMSSPESDCNSNPHIIGPLGCSIASSQDFTHDNSDYQWVLDYG